MCQTCDYIKEIMFILFTINYFIHVMNIQGRQIWFVN